MFPPGLEPGTFRVLGGCDNRYTTETLCDIITEIQLFQVYQKGKQNKQNKQTNKQTNKLTNKKHKIKQRNKLS